MIVRHARLAVGFLLAGLLLAAPVLAEDAPAATAAPEAVKIDAFAPFAAELRMIQTGETTAGFVGSLEGTLYIDSGKGPVANGDLGCVGMFEISLADGSLKGSGKCTVAADDGAQAFGSWTCEGYHLIGCQGPFTIDGGSGRLVGLTGKGPVTLRSNFHAVAETAGGQVVQQTEGILFWKGLELSLPVATPAAQ